MAGRDERNNRRAREWANGSTRAGHNNRNSRDDTVMDRAGCRTSNNRVHNGMGVGNGNSVIWYRSKWDMDSMYRVVRGWCRLRFVVVWQWIGYGIWIYYT